MTDAPGVVSRAWVEFVDLLLVREDDVVSLLSDPTGLVEVTDQAGFYALRVLVTGDFDMGFVDRRIVEGGSELVFEATVAPEGATVEEEDVEVEGTTYTITSATCEPPVG